MQKKLLALVATVAMVLSMFAGIAFAEPVDHSSRVTTDGEVDGINKVITVALDPETVPEVPNGETPPVTAKWFKAFVLAAPGAGYEVKQVVRDGKDLTIYPDGIPGLTAWRVAEDRPYTMEYTITWGKESATDITETWIFNYEPLPDGDPRSITLSTTKVISSYPNNGYQLISGNFLASNADYKVHVLGAYPKAGGGYVYKELFDQPVNAKGGNFSFYLPTDLLPQDVKVVAELNGIVVAEASIEVRYNVTVDPKLEFSYTGEQNPVAITGKVTNSKGEPVENVKVQLGTNYFGPDGVRTNSKGEFGYVVLQWPQAEELVLYVDGLVPGEGDPVVPRVGPVPHVEGEVKAKAATLKVTPNTTAHTLVEDQEFKLEGSGFKANTSVTIKYDKLTGAKIGGAADQFTVTADANGKFEVTLVWSPTKAGTYTITAKSASHEAKATISVTNPASINWMNTDLLDELEVGDNVITFGTSAGVHVLTYDGKNKVIVADYVVVVDGKEKLDTRKEGAGNTVTISPTKLSTVTVEVTAYNGTTKVASRTFTAKVKGLDVEVDTTELTVNQKHTITFVVKDAEGVPVNNATIKFGTSTVVNPSEVNIQNGTYVVKDYTPKAVQPITVSIEAKDAKATLTLDVVGDKVYAVTADVDALLQGKGEDVELVVTRDGVGVMAQRIKWVYEDGTYDEAHPSYLGDGVNKVKITAKKAGTLVVRAENFDGTLCGETTIEVVAPKLVLIDEEVVYLTNNFKTKVHFKVVDPRDDSVIKDNLTIDEGDYISDLDVYDANDGLLADTILGGEEHVLTILAQVTPKSFEDAEEEEEVVAVSFKLGETLVDGVFEVKNATITSDPEMIIIGAKNNLTLTYLDANGKPIVGKTVKANNADLGKTDDNGQVIYPAGVVAEPVKVVASTDTTATVEKTIKIGYDFEAPQVTYEVDGNKATLVITDNVRLVRINIDGKDIDFWPGARYEHVVTLNPGVNKVRVKAQDSNDNVLDEVVEIEYKTDSVKLEGETVKRQGDFLFVQLRQFEELGAQIAWNQATRTATFVVGDTKVEITVGSTTAMVNGQAVTMPVAAFIDAALGRTYVPVRFVSEALGWNVHWAQGDIVTITLP